MADNTGIPFNLLTEEEVEELFHTVSDPSGSNAPIGGGTVSKDHYVPGDVVNPPSGLGKTGFERVGMGRVVHDSLERIAKAALPDGKVYPLPEAEEDDPIMAFHFGKDRFIPGVLNFSDENGYPTCHTQQCGYCRECKRRQAVRTYFGGSPNRAIMMGGGFRRGEQALYYSDVPFFSSPRTGPLLFSNPSQRNGMMYNLEEGWDDIITKLIMANNMAGLDFINKFTKIPQVSHQISDIEVRGDGSVVASYITPNRPVNVGTVGHVDMPSLWDTLGTVISVSNAGVTVGGKLVYKFRALPAKHYFGGDYMGDSMSRNGRHGAVPIDSHSYVPLITAPKKSKAKREQWAQDALDTMIYNDYIGNSDRVAIGKLRQTVLHNAKRALKNKGLDKETPSLKDLFAKHGK